MSRGADGVSWSDFEASAPALATLARGILERFGFVLLGTVRADGAPRISAVEVHLVNGQLMLAMIPGSHKARDARRDPRVVLQTPVTRADEPGAELKLHGRVVEVDRAQAEATADAVEARSGWRPGPSWLYLAVAVERAAHLGWERGELELVRWDREHGRRGPERHRLDVAAGAYRPVER